MGIIELGHVNLWVSGLDRSVAFYRDVLGFTQVARGVLKGREVAFFSLGTRHHDLALVEAQGATANAAPPRQGLNHIGLKVGNGLDDLRHMRDALIARGVTPSRYVEHRVCQSMHVDDPDGNTIELYVDADPAIWAGDPQSIVCSEPLRLDGWQDAVR
jgi:catechol 2,3-dioxygenase